MQKARFRVPVELEVTLNLDDPVARVHRWRTWPKEEPPMGVDLLIRFRHANQGFCFVGMYESDGDFVDAIGVSLFCPHGFTEDELGFDELVFRGSRPKTIQWIPLDELLEGVEDAEE